MTIMMVQQMIMIQMTITSMNVVIMIKMGVKIVFLEIMIQAMMAQMLTVMANVILVMLTYNY